MKTKYLLIPLLVFFLSACVSVQGPENSAVFANVKSLEEFSGTYSNVGNSGSATSAIYLSRLIWPEAETKDHTAIQTISFQIASKNEIRIDAISAGKTVRK